MSKSIGNWFSLFLCLVGLSQGCAFKKGGNDGSPNFLAKNGNLSQVDLIWDGRKESMTLHAHDLIRRDQLTWVREKRVSLPTRVSDKLAVSMTLLQDPQTLGSVGAYAATTSGESLLERPLGVESVNVSQIDSGTKVDVALSGLSLLLREDREQSIYLNLTLSHGGVTLQRLRLNLSTPPSDFDIVERNALPGAAPLELSSQSMTLRLVERIRIRSNSQDVSTLNLPYRIDGQVLAKLTKYWPEPAPHPNPHVLFHKQGVSLEARNQDVDLYVVPGVSGIEHRWVELSSVLNRSVTLRPYEELDIGLYVPSESFKFISDSKSAHLSPVQATFNARATCPGGITNLFPVSVNGDEGGNYCYSMASHYGFSATAIAACKESVKQMRKCAQASMPSDSCDAAALADDIVDQNRSPHPNNHIPWPIYMGCPRNEINSERRLQYIHLGWVWVPEAAEFKEGYALEKLSLAPKSETPVSGTLQFNTGHVQADKEMRSIDLFLSETSVQ